MTMNTNVGNMSMKIQSMIAMMKNIHIGECVFYLQQIYYINFTYFFKEPLRDHTNTAMMKKKEFLPNPKIVIANVIHVIRRKVGIEVEPEIAVREEVDREIIAAAVPEIWREENLAWIHVEVELEKSVVVVQRSLGQEIDLVLLKKEDKVGHISVPGPKIKGRKSFKLISLT